MKINENLLKKLVFILALISATSFNAFSQIESDYDHNVNFSQFKTYDFKPGVSINHGQTDKNNTLLDQKVNNAVAAQLNSKGLKQSSDNPDLIVTYTFGVQQKTQIENMGPAYAGPGFYSPNGWWAGSWNNWWVNTYDEGTLIIDVIDTTTDKLVYRVYGAGEVKKPSKQQKEINKIAEKGFRDMPR